MFWGKSPPPRGTQARCCGLLPDRDRLHLKRRRAVAYVGCGLLPDRDRLHLIGLVGIGDLRCGLLPDRDRLHSPRSRQGAAVSCGLLPDRDRLHCQRNPLPQRLVVDCSRIGIGYTPTTSSKWSVRLWIAPGSGSVTLLGQGLHLHPLRCGLLPDRDRLHWTCVGCGPSTSCGLLPDRDRLHCRPSRTVRLACCGLLPDRDRLHLRPRAVGPEAVLWIAPGSGSVTLKNPEAEILSIAVDDGTAVTRPLP